jgi:oligopeptide/dipeptide ABC transporter ATP-binding protein
MRKLRGRELSIVFQNPNTYLNPVMRIGDQIAESAALHLGISRKEASRRAIEVLEQVRVTAPERVARSYPYELSGGMNQRVLIAIAIVCKPNLIILDEPTTALDVMVQREILGLLRRLKESRERSMIFITHDFGLVAELADRVYVMYAGRVVEHGDVFQIFNAPRHPYTQALMKSVPSMTEIVDPLQSIDGSVPDLGSSIPGCLFAPRCSHVLDRCRAEAPVMELSSQTSSVACWRAA